MIEEGGDKRGGEGGQSSIELAAEADEQARANMASAIKSAMAQLPMPMKMMSRPPKAKAASRCSGLGRCEEAAVFGIVSNSNCAGQVRRGNLLFAKDLRGPR